MKRYLLASMILMAATALAAPATAENFPTKPIKFLIPFNPGGQSDVAVLLLRPGLEEYLKVNIVPQYQPGGGGAVGWAMLARAKNDGYMMAVTNLPHILVQPLVTKGVEYKTADLAPVYLYATTPGGIAVKSDDDRFKTLQDLIGYAKQNPQKLSIGGTGKFTGNHLGYLQFNQDAGIDTTYVSFNGAAPQTAAILGGHVDAIYGGTFIFSNNPDKLRILALATEERLDGFPGVPTFKELGIDLIQGIDRGVTVPAGTPRNIIDKLAGALNFAAAKPEFKDGMHKAGFELLNLGPDEFAAFIKNKTEQYMQVLKKAGLLK